MPATTVDDVCIGYKKLAPLLLSRAVEDVATYGARVPSHLIVKWKLFPGAKEVLYRILCAV
jgi:hypothetical protein